MSFNHPTPPQLLANVTISHPSCWKISSAFNPATLYPSHWQQATSYSHPIATMLTSPCPLEKWPKTPPIWLQKVGINRPLLFQQKKVRFQLIYTSKTYSHIKEIPIPQLFTQHSKTGPKHSLSTITHSKNHPHPYQNQNLIIFLFFLLINNKEKTKIQAISTAQIIWPRTEVLLVQLLTL